MTARESVPVADDQFEYEILDDVVIHEYSAWTGVESELAAAVKSEADAGRAVLSIGPKRYWIVGDAKGSVPGIAVTEISSGLRVFRMSGGLVREVLGRGLPIDTHPNEFPDDHSATSLIDGITVTVHRVGKAFDLYCRRSYAESLEHWLKDTSNVI